jgi:hypothetical protein
MSSCRPISLLTAFFNVLEKVMHSKLSHYLQNNNILVPGLWTVHIGGIFSDLAKTFHCVNHDILLTFKERC